MSLAAKYTKEELKKLPKEIFMQEATFLDMVTDYGQIFSAAYLIRESTKHEDQVKALQVQKKMVEGFLESHFQFVVSDNNKFIEEGTSGLCQTYRDVFQIMIESAKQRKFEILVVDAVSRLARNVGELFTCIDTLKEYGVGVLVMKGNYWTFNMGYNDILRLAVEAGLAQAESMQTSVRVRDHMKTIGETGQLFGGDLFGYRLHKAVERVNNTLDIEPTEAFTVRTIFEKYASDDPEEMLSTTGLVQYLIRNEFKTFVGDLNWSAGKVRRILCNEKYMGYQMYGKSKVVDVVRKKKVLTKIEPVRETTYDENGNVLQKCNLVRGNWEPIVSEELWWKAYYRRKSRSDDLFNNKAKVRNGIRISSDAYARKLFCSCGYTMSPQYTHVAKDGKYAQIRYRCRQQINQAVLRTSGLLKEEDRHCRTSAFMEGKVWLTSKYVFQHIFRSGKDAVLKSVALIEESRQQEFVSTYSENEADLIARKDKLEARLKQYIVMKADGEITSLEFKEATVSARKEVEEIENSLSNLALQKARVQSKILDLDLIKQKLDSYIDFSRERVSDELIEMFVERIIYRGNDEFLWVINLSGDATGSGLKYRIKGYDEQYAKYLQDDRNFNIVAQFLIPEEECKKYYKEVLKRGIKNRFWKTMTVKIAIC